MGETDCADRSYIRVRSKNADLSSQERTSSAFKRVSRGNSAPFLEGCRRDCPEMSKKSGVLFKVLSSSKDKWEMETHFGSQEPEQVSDEAIFLYDHASGSPPDDAGRRVHDLLGSSGRLLPYSTSSEAQEILKIPGSRSTLPVQGTSIWPQVGASDFYKMYGINSSPPQARRPSSIPIHRQLAHQSIVKGQDDIFNRSLYQSFSKTGFDNKLGEIMSSASEQNAIPRCVDRCSSKKSFSNSGAYKQVEHFDKEFHGEEDGSCETLQVSNRAYGVVHRSNTVLKTTHEADPARVGPAWKKKEGSWEDIVVMTRRLKTSFDMVGNAVKFKFRSFIPTCDRQVGSHNRCIHGRMGSSLATSLDQRSEEERLLHINVLELHAIRLGLQAFLPRLSSWVVLVRTDDTTSMYYITKQGGTRSLPLSVHKGYGIGPFVTR